MNEEIYVNYAAALFSLSKDENKVSTYLKEVKQVEDVFSKNPEFLEYFSSHKISRKDVNKILETAFKDLESPSLLPFLKLLATKHLISSIHEIFREYRTLANEYLGIKEGLLYSTSPLKGDEIAKIEKALESKLNCQVHLINKIDKNLIGGIKIVLDGKIYDGSIQNKIDSLRHKLLKGGSL